MAVFVLRRVDRGGYVARSGERRSYVQRLPEARRYPTRKAAEADRCGNEFVSQIEA